MGLPPARLGGKSGKARQSTPAAPVSVAVRAAPAGHAVGLLDEGDAHAELQRRPRCGCEVARLDSAARAVPQHEPAARLVRARQLHARRAVWRFDVHHLTGVCRPMSFRTGDGRTSEIESKGPNR